MSEHCLCRIELEAEDTEGIILSIDDLRKRTEMDLGDAVIEVERDVPLYDGPYSVTPGSTAQTLDTSGKKLISPVTVGAIPQNYGLITYNGRIITVS